MKMRFICLLSVVLLLHLAEIYGDNEILDKLESMSERMGNIEETLVGLVDAISKLENVYECGWPKLAGGHFEGNSSYYRGVLQAFCGEDYTLKGESLIRCKPDGIWTEIPKCVRQCKAPNVPNSVEFGETYYNLDSEVSVRCKLGYRRSGSRTLQCLGDNKWSDTVACNIVDCGTPPNGKYGRYGPGYLTTFNSTISLKCMDGYQRVGTDVIRCTGWGNWVGEQSCLKRVCIDISVHGIKECLLKQSGTFYMAGDIIGELSTDDPERCFQFCFLNYASFSYISMNSEFRECACHKQSGNDYPERYGSFDTYIREDSLSIYSSV